jgi:hypothetical protein
MKAKISIKLIFCSIVLGLILFSLTGCVSMKKRQERYIACVCAPTLYTDLLRPADCRPYSLPSGEICPGYGGR